MLDDTTLISESSDPARAISLEDQGGADASDDAPDFVYDFDTSFQRKILSLMLRDEKFAREIHGLVEPVYFENDALASIAAVAIDFFETYKSAPGATLVPQIIKDWVASKRIRKDLIPDIREELRGILSGSLAAGDFVVKHVEKFAQHRAYEEAAMKAVELLEKGDVSKIKELFDKAALVGANRGSLDYDYADEIDARTEHREDMKAGRIERTGISTGIDVLDAMLYHGGWGRKELSVMLGAAKAGKSMSLGEFAQHAWLAGNNVLYVTCEVSVKIISDRLDARLSDTAMRGLNENPQIVRDKIVNARKNGGIFKLREYPSGVLKVSELVRVIEEYKARGVTFDLIVVDYADIMSPERKNDQARDDTTQIYIDLRAVAFNQNAALLTATQTNRTGATKYTSTATDVAEDFNKVRTCDVMIAINASEDEIASGEARLTIAASRNQAGNISILIKQDRAKMRFCLKVLNVNNGAP